MLRLVIGVGVILGLSACSSYQPLYGKQENGSSVVAALSDIAIPEQKTRAGQVLRNELLSSIAPASTAGSEAHSLKLDVSERAVTTSRNSLTKVERVRYRLSAQYELLQVASGTVMTQGKSFSEVSFDRVAEPISDIQAEANAMKRAAAELAQDIKLRLAAHFAKAQ